MDAELRFQIEKATLREERNLRALGCPKEIAARVSAARRQKRMAEASAPVVAPPKSKEATADAVRRARAEAIRLTIEADGL
jgi:hypothetical protein